MLKNYLTISILVCILSQVLASHTPRISATDLDGYPDDMDIGPYTRVEHKLYYFGQSKVSWFEATLICRSMGGYLASFDNHHELAALSHYLHVNYPTDRWWWLSGSDLQREGDFYWYRTGQRIAYADWSHGQPDNNGGNENCVHLWFIKTKFQMNDWRCNQAAFYICEADRPKTVIVTVF